MVEREHSKSSTVFPESLTTNNSSLECSSNVWLLNDATPNVKTEELCNSDMLNIELLYGSVLPTNETFSSINPIGRSKENDSIFLQAISPNDILSMSDATPYDLFYNDKNMTCANDYWNTMSEKNTSVSDSYFEANSPLSFWGNCPLDVETLKMDDVFQVDKDDLVQSPTLAELNANDESLFDSFDNFDANLPLEHISAKTSLLTPALNSSIVYKLSSKALQLKPSSETSSVRTNLLSTSCGKSDNASEIEVKPSFTPKEIKIEPSVSVEPIAIPPKTLDLTSEVITKIVKKTYSANELSIKNSEEEKTETVSECAGLSSFSNQEALDSEEDDSEMDCDYSSDVDEESDEETKGHSSKHGTAKNILLQKKKSRYFWQYNIQSKGPKAPKMKLDGKPTVSNNTSAITDPVFASNHFIKGIKHAGKARRGDGNDLTPNPLKLYNIGMELEKLTSVIEGLVPANELPLNARSKSRKEKNKLASRACRLKKKAQHEANKLKLFGLQKEQKNLLSIITEVKKILRKSVDSVKQKKMLSNAHSKIGSLCMKKRSVEVAGCSAEFVNNVLKIVDSGDRTGGLDIVTHDE